VSTCLAHEIAILREICSYDAIDVARLETSLDLRLAAPSSAACCSVSRGNGVALNFVEDINAEQSAGKPEASREEGESLSSLPLVANTSTIETTPLERRAAVDLVDPVDEGTKSSEPSEARDKINWVVHEAGGEGKEPDQAENDGPGGDDFGVDFAAERSCVVTMVNMKKVADDAKNDCGADKLRKSEDE